MKLIPVESSCIAALGYASRSHVLGIEFVSGKFYHYFDVPSLVYQRLLHAESHGACFNELVKDRYRFSPAPKPRKNQAPTLGSRLKPAGND
jgi:hypothetical protein